MSDKEFKKKLKSIVGACSKIKKLGVLYLFGSRATGEVGPLSDFDFAAYINEADPVKRFKLRSKIIVLISKILDTDDVDVVDLAGSKNPTLKYNVIKDGKLLFERAPYRLKFEPRVLSEYFDYRACLAKAGL